MQAVELDTEDFERCLAAEIACIANVSRALARRLGDSAFLLAAVLDALDVPRLS